MSWFDRGFVEVESIEHSRGTCSGSRGRLAESVSLEVPRGPNRQRCRQTTARRRGCSCCCSGSDTTRDCFEVGLAGGVGRWVVLPVPWLGGVGKEPEARRVAYEPAIGRCLPQLRDVLRVVAATQIEIDGAARVMGAAAGWRDPFS